MICMSITNSTYLKKINTSKPSIILNYNDDNTDSDKYLLNSNLKNRFLNFVFDGSKHYQIRSSIRNKNLLVSIQCILLSRLLPG